MENQGLDLSGLSIDKILADVPIESQSQKVEETIAENPKEEKVEETKTEEVQVQEQTVTETEETEVSMEENQQVAESEEPTEEPESIFSELNSFMGVEMDTEGYKDDVSGLASYTKDLSNQMADEMLNNIFSAFPDVKDYLDIRMAGGNASQFVESFVSAERISSTEITENESQWKSLVSEHYRLTGMGEDDISAMIEDFNDTGILKNQAERSLKFLKSHKEKQAEAIKERELKEYQQREEQVQKQWQEIQEVVSNGHVKGMVIPQRERNKFYEWMSRPTENGQTEAMNKRESMDMQTAVAIEYLLYKDFDFGSLANNVSKTKKAASLRSKLSSNKSASSRMGGKKGFNPSSSKGFRNISDILNK